MIEDPAAVPGEPMHRHGWLSLEILVGDVDSLAAGLEAPFTVLGPPANLELSDAIRASQVLGPCGELLYLTQIKAAVPPFDLPMTDATVAVPFIGVMSTPDREASRRAWSALLNAITCLLLYVVVVFETHSLPLLLSIPFNNSFTTYKYSFLFKCISDSIASMET